MRKITEINEINLLIYIQLIGAKTSLEWIKVGGADWSETRKLAAWPLQCTRAAPTVYPRGA